MDGRDIELTHHHEGKFTMSAFLTTVINGGSACFTRYGDVNHLIALCAKIFDATFESFKEAAPSAVDASFDFLDLKAAPKLATVTPKFAPSTACLGPRAAAARAKAAEAPIQATLAEAVEAPARDFPEAIQCDLLPNVFKESSDEPDLIGEVTLDGEKLVIYAVENKRARKNQPVWLLEFVTDVAQQREARKRLTAIRTHYFEDYMEYVKNPPKCGGGFHDWLKGAANRILAPKFTVLTGCKFTTAQAMEILELSSIKAGADVVRPGTWRTDVRSTVANVLGSESSYNGTGGERVEKPKAMLNMERILELAPTYTRAQLIAESPVKFYVEDNFANNHCREAHELLFRELLSQGDYRLALVEKSANGEGMKPLLCTPETVQHPEVYPWIVPHLMKPEGGRTDRGRGHKSDKCNDAVAKACFGVIEFDFKPESRDENALEVLARLNAAEIPPKDAMAAIIKHLAEYGRLVMVVDSGNGSLHAWFWIGDVNEADWQNFRGYANSLGSDKGGNALSQQFRNPDGYHTNGNRQNILYFNPITPPPVG
jgi:hypothetical protein